MGCFLFRMITLFTMAVLESGELSFSSAAYDTTCQHGPKNAKIETSLHFYIRSDTHFPAQMSSGAECVSRPDRDAAPKT